MRPIERGTAPQVFDNYEDAKPRLVEILGIYCSYCERRVVSLLAVEHIQPKGLPQYKHLVNEWSNFLLACPNCNSAKRDKPVEPDNFFLPDRDNTHRAFRYDRDGRVWPAADLSPRQKLIAQDTIDLISLNKQDARYWTDPNLAQAALERWSQRQLAFVLADESFSDLNKSNTEPHQRSIARTAAQNGCFSIWMQVFAGKPKMQKKLIEIFPGTSRLCYDSKFKWVPRPGGKL